MPGIYLHIPFCKQACSYCDFYFVTQSKYRDRFVDKLVEEIRYRGESAFARHPVETIYFGGGTPSQLRPEHLERILSTLRDTFETDLQEVTLEMNPDDVTADYLQSLRQAGITRASMGVQSFQPELLEFMHRAHNREEALECLQLLGDAGFDSYTVDLIYGNPGQDLEMLDRDLDMLLPFAPPHVSAYSLTIEKDTRLGKQFQLGRLKPAEDDLVARHFDRVADRLEAAGMRQYEVSNYALPGSEAVHNASYWRHEPYLGFGPGAHSFAWFGGPDTARRWQNKADLRHYLDADPPQMAEAAESLTQLQLAEERLFMGLRTLSGVTEEELKNRYDYSLSGRQQAYLQRMREEGKMRLDDGLFLTRRGRKIADAIVLDLITQH